MAKKNLSNRIASLERQIADIRVRAVEASEFRLVDKSGRVRGVLEMSRTGPRLALMHEDGTVSLEVALANDGPSIRLADESNVTRVFVGATRNEARIGLADAEKKPRIFLNVKKSGKPTIATYDNKQKRIWGATRLQRT
jgi:hypothetical protein